MATRWTAEDVARAQRKAATPPASTAPKAKYRNRKVSNEHGKFDSQKEAQRYAELVLLERAGAIAGLRRQVPYALVVNGVHVCDYRPDYVYREGYRLVCEDAKGVRTPVYLLKKRLMLACHGIEVKET